MLYAESEAVNKKIAEEKEAARAAEMKKEQLKDAVKQAETALQAVYDLSDGCISVVVKNGKVSVTNCSRVEASRKSRYDKFSDNFWTELLEHLG
jgi:uncharacterized protein (DUF3084 family)